MLLLGMSLTYNLVSARFLINFFCNQMEIRAFGGLSGAAFVLCHRRYVLFMRKNKRISSFLQKKYDIKFTFDCL